MWTRLIADLETPVSAYLKLADSQPYSCLLESVEGGANIGRYSIIAWRPDLIWQARDLKPAINRAPHLGSDEFVADDKPTLNSLRALMAESRLAPDPAIPPMAVGGLFGYLGYDMVRLVEEIPADNADDLNLADAVLMRPTLIAVFDNIERTITLATPVRPTDTMDAEAAYQAGAQRLNDALQALNRTVPVAPSVPKETVPTGDPQSNMTPNDYMAAVDKAKEYILAGDAFQIVPAQRFSRPFPLPPFALYRALRRLNPSPFLFFVNFDGFSVVGSSPEILVRVRDGKVTIRPLAGTRPRGADSKEDTALAEDLLADPKEIAEHLMLLDLGRNDVGRVAKLGSVEVTEQFQIERYSHVMHIVSNVDGDLRDDCDPFDALMAGFPAGTVSGAPKVRAMEIIDEIEASKRGIYAGCVGYFGADGSMDNCIALRTAVVKDGTMYVQAGAGVVADSDSAKEHEETVNKAKALFRAADEALSLASR
ncbi:MAG: anthranilate synthase component I [Pseudomonadota bacterium]